MAAGDEEEEVGKLETVGEARGERVALEMIDGDERLVRGERDRLGRREADEHAADEAGTGGGGDGVDIAEYQ